MKACVGFIFVAIALAAPAGPKPPPPLVSQTDTGLLYGKDPHGNHIPDFSSCGYAGGDRDIPFAPVKVVVTPAPGDETARIQKALDCVAGLPADTNGLRGAVLLLSGRHEVSGGLLLTNSGVVLRGQGAGEEGTTLAAIGTDRRTLIRVVGRKDCATRSNAAWLITDAYVPVGATSLRLQSTSGLRPGDSVRVIRPSTPEWIARLGASDFGGGEGGGWKPGQHDLAWNRKILSLDSNAVTLDAPITTALEAELGAGRVEVFSWPGRLANLGIENLRLESTCAADNPKDENHSWFAITMEDAADAWVRQVAFKHFAGSAVALYESCQRVTVEDCLSRTPVSEDGGYRRNTFFTMGQQTLFLRCCAEHGRHDFSVGDCAAGPNAFVQCEATMPAADSGAIESWSSGTLFDNVRIDGQALSLGYRPGNMAAIGWAAANSVLWNCSASIIRCWNPPGAQNWSFGSWAGFEGDGIWRDSNNFTKPESLFAAQLAERAGRSVRLISRATKESSNPTVQEAAALIAASRQPAPSLADYIAAAGQRNPIPAEPGDAKRVDEIPEAKPAPKTTKTISVRNGWIVCAGKLLVGAARDTAWWRGSIRPGESPAFGPALTRFVPGRIGEGLTDDLDALAEDMARSGCVSFDHHYGLWYDIRRDDHERVRRMTGDVIPPFFELPFARSGEGTAWDGLSKYDLTKFNPWYWSRLKGFADLCDEHGLVLFHQNYFQHNIIEAGAHWADFPWRSANNINNTGFPEPPPYAGDKRIFMAEQFYDVTNPARRKLHEGFIRQCLDNFTNNANVIQFTSAEFTGPLPFMQFWLDTIAEWQTARGSRRKEAQTQAASDQSLLTSAATKPLIALSCTKDVQDAILADPQRSAVVDVIDFRYWWRTDKGEFAPPGGKNLAPRQFERQWRGGKPNDANLAGMAAEYHAKFPRKPLICDFDAAGWAWVCAGGSLPRLPKTTDAKLLAAIPHMQPWAEASKKDRWVLRETGRQMLVYGGGELDLSGESGTFRMNTINPRTGGVTPGETVQAGGTVKLPAAAVIWLTKQ